VATAGGGVEIQVEDGVSGHVVDDTASMAARLTELVEDAGLAIEMGTAGRRQVQERFLVTRLLEDELRLLESVLGDGAGTLSA
jgi:trehalose synthase